MSTIIEEPSSVVETTTTSTTRTRRSERSFADKSFPAKSPRHSTAPEPVPHLEPEPVVSHHDLFAQIPDVIVDMPADPTTIEPSIDPNLEEGPPSVAPFSVPPPSNAPPSVAPASVPPVSSYICIKK